jgi:hypothetical protein
MSELSALMDSLKKAAGTKSVIPLKTKALLENDLLKQQFIEANGVDAYNRAVEKGGAYVNADGFKEIPPGSPFTRGAAATGVDPANPRRNEMLVELGGEAGPAPKVVGGETRTNLMQPDKYYVVQPDGSVARSPEFMGSVQYTDPKTGKPTHDFAKELQFPDGGYLYHKGVNAQPAMRPSIGVDPSVGNEGVRIYGGNVLGDIRTKQGGPNREYRDLLAITREGGTVPENMERLKSLLLTAGAAGAAGQAEAAMPDAQQPQQQEVKQPTDTQSTYVENIYDYVQNQQLSNEYVNDIHATVQHIMGPEAGVDLIKRMDAATKADGKDTYSFSYGMMLMVAANETNGDIGQAAELLQGRLESMDEATLRDIGAVSQAHFDGKYKIPTYRTQEQLDQLGKEFGGNPDQYLTPEGVINHSYLRGADLALAGVKEDFYKVRPQFNNDQPRPFGMGMASAGFDAGINATPLQGDEEVEKRLSEANNLYGVANIPKTLAPEMQTIMLPDGTPRYYMYRDDTVMGQLGNIQGPMSNMNPVGRTQNFLNSFRSPLADMDMANRSGIPREDIRQIGGYMQQAEDRPVGIMPEGTTPEAFSDKIKRYKDYAGKVAVRTEEEAGPAFGALMGYEPMDRRFLSGSQKMPLNLLPDATLDVSNALIPFAAAGYQGAKTLGKPLMQVGKAAAGGFGASLLSPKDDAVAELVAGTAIPTVLTGTSFLSVPDANEVGLISGTTATDPDFFKKFDAGTEQMAKEGQEVYEELDPLYRRKPKEHKTPLGFPAGVPKPY